MSSSLHNTVVVIPDVEKVFTDVSEVEKYIQHQALAARSRYVNTPTFKSSLSTERKYLVLKAGTRKPGFCFCVTSRL